MKENYLRMDLKRLLKDYRFYLSVLGVAVSLFYSLEYRGLRQSVIDSYFMAVTLSGQTLTYIFCVLPYAFVFGEDLEHNYVRYQIIRGNLCKYVISKAAVIYLSAVAVMALGTMVFVGICRAKLPWTAGGSANGILAHGVYGMIFEQGHYGIYCLLYAVQLGLLAGILAVFSAFLSLFISNKVMIAALPVCVYQMICNFSKNIYFSVFIFHPYNKLWEKDWQCILFLCSVSLLFVFIFTAGILKRLKKRI